MPQLHDFDHRTVETMLTALDDVRQFFDENRVSPGDLWRRYNKRARHSDDVDVMAFDDFEYVLERASDDGKIEVDIFGVMPTWRDDD